MPFRPEDIEALYQEHGSEILGYLTKRCPDGAARDLLQETFLQVLRQAERGDTAAAPRAWIFGIARHVLFRHWRNRPDDAADGAALASLSGAPVTEDERVQTMREAIVRLPPDLRETLELRIEHELSYEEIASVLQTPIGTVRSRLHHAVRRLRSALGASQKPL